ncbi:MAG: hypothetical protein WDZ40_00855 [Candidatus Spechtbacterales bacterium]
MGKLIKLKPEFIKPSQDFLKEGTIKFILSCYKEGKLDALPPAPIVRKQPGKPDTYIAIDGHNLLAVCEFFGKECEVYLAASADDFLPNSENKESISQRNKDLVDKYESSIEEAQKINLSFKELVDKYITKE